MKRTYRAVLEAQLAAIDEVKAGAATASIDRAARRVLQRFGLGPGIRPFDGPRAGPGNPRGAPHRPPRQEPPASRYGDHHRARGLPGGIWRIRIEDTVVVTANGCEILTPPAKSCASSKGASLAPVRHFRMAGQAIARARRSRPTAGSRLPPSARRW